MGSVWPQILGKTADSRAESHAEIPSGAARHEDATKLRCLVRGLIRVFCALQAFGAGSAKARRLRNQTFLFAASDVGAARRRPTTQAMSSAGSAKRSAASCVSTPGRPAAPPNA